MAGIYLHIPYCKQACHYCDFHFSTNTKTRDAMVYAMLREMELRRSFIPDETVKTIYFGGGTPSLLNAAELLRLLDQIRLLWPVEPEAEITLEANPDDLTLENLSKLKQVGINRLSIGIQSFEQEHLTWMNRGHDALQAEVCIEKARQAGFENLTVDLIYGFPHLTEEQWRQNIQRVIDKRLPHISCYSLTVEPRTALERFIKDGLEQEPEEADAVRHFEILTTMLENAGYEHYEVSNFALPGFRSRHNNAYWTGDSYLGIGPSAHSFNGSQRCWNIRNNHQYIRDIQGGQFAPESENIDPITAYNEYLLTRLRTSTGIDVQEMKDRFDIDFNATFKAALIELFAEEKVIEERGRIKLTRKGFLWADDIASQFFRISE